MKFIRASRNLLEKILDYFTMSLLLVLLAFGSYALLDAYQVNHSADLDQATVALEPSDSDYLKKLKALRQKNPEIVAWLKIDQTNINRPVTQTSDNSKYLTRNHLGDYSTSGAAFVDYRNSAFPKDDYILIYGHRMSGDLMFSDITKFKTKDYFQQHQTGKLYTLDGIFQLKLLLFAVPDLDQTTIYNVSTLQNSHNSYILNELRSIATHQTVLATQTSRQLLLLSTCDQDAKHYRDVLLYQMIKK